MGKLSLVRTRPQTVSRPFSDPTSHVNASRTNASRAANARRRAEQTFRGVNRGRGLVCLTPPNASEPGGGPRHEVVSELAAWLHGFGWPVEIVTANDPSSGLSRALGRETGKPELLGLSYRLKRLGPWLVHVFEPSEATAARMAGAPYVISVRTPSNSAMASAPGARDEFESGLSNARRVITPSRTAARTLLENFGFESAVVPDGVDAERLSAVPARRTRPLVVCPVFEVGDGDLALLVDAFLRLVSTVSDAQLVIAGRIDAKVHAELVSRMPEHLRGRLVVLDKADRRRVLTMFGRASVTCFPSATGSSAKSVVESLAIGTPVVCAEGGAAAEVIDEDAVAAGAGVRFSAGDSDACASSMIRVMDGAGSEAVVDGCRARAYLFDWTFVGPRLVELYRHATGST